ncbi:hypothetical protein BOTCAL_0258g00180 [Botryotinia calthae]|uniref:F-box domain-containing protein n=1 Tax=Botryotinia calthae TaxID=38488 RepID=A0A4Y8CX50_9HELO|nr:hypothetical protein BOTCAL_0258g00180 [Botryotinia calthae]
MDSNAWSIPWPREPPVVVRSLQKLPREIVHQILSDLPFIKILSILSWKLPYINECVLSHMVYGRLFRSQGEISHVLDHYTLYREICWFHSWPAANAKSLFARSPQMILSHWENLDYMIKEMRRLIRAGLNINYRYIDLFVKYGRPRPRNTDINFDWNVSPFDLESCWNYWNWVKFAKMQLNQRKSEQIKFSARLIEKYPRILKRPLDPSQGTPRPNTTHIVVMLDRLAMKTLKNRKFLHYWGLNQSLRKSSRYVIELVPYDLYLRLLLDTLAKYPLDVEVTGLEETLANVSLHNGAQGATLENTESATMIERQPNDFKYSDDIANSLRTVLKGLMYIYTEPSLTIPRVQWESLRDVDSSGKWPRFFVDRGKNEQIEPCDEREYEWIAAFVKVVTWIELNIGPAKEDF